MDPNVELDLASDGNPSSDQRQWRDISAFDALDESWTEPQSQEVNIQPIAGTLDEGRLSTNERLNSKPIEKMESNEQKMATLSSDSDHVASSSSTAKLSPLKASQKINVMLSKTVGTDADWRYVQSSLNYRDDTAKRRRGKLRRKSSGAMTDTELLQPGPSGPSLRIPSHKLPSLQSAETIDSQGLDDQMLPPKASSVPSSPSLSASLAFQDPQSPSRTARSSSTSSSGEKQGAHISIQSHNPIPPLTSQRVTALRMLDSRPPQPNSQNDSFNLNGDQFDSAREDVSVSQAAVTAEEVTFIEHSNIASPPAFMKPAWAKKDKKGRARDIFAPMALQTMFEPPSDTSRLAWRTSEEGDERPKETEEDKLLETDSLDKDHSEEAKAEEGEGEISPRLVDDLDPVPLSKDSAADVQQEEDAVALEVRPASQNDIPQCTFTFSSPVTQPKRPPPTPSTSHAPLRLFQFNGLNPEIEQILNTPRSAVKSRDAKRIVWKLVEEEGKGEREKKRLRMDCLPISDDLPNFQESEELADSDQITSGAPRLLDRIRAIGNTSTNRTISSSLIANRKGAKAPTPERALQYRRFLPTPSPLRRGESPRKLLRRWSAANQVDEEIETESKQLDLSTSDDAWQDLADEDAPARIPSTSSSISPMVRIPSVSIDPPESPGSDKIEAVADKQNSIAALAKSTSQPGMLHISPDAIPLQEMEAMSNGKMTFDRKMNRWIRTRQLQKRQGNEKGISAIEEDTTDPFHDFESIPSLAENGFQRRAKNPSFIASKNSLRSPSTSDKLVPPPKWSPSSLASSGALLTPAKNNLVDPNRSVTPRSILKTAGAASRWPLHEVTPTITRQANRKISFADNVAQPLHSQSRGRDQRKDKINELLHQLSVLALGSDEEDEEATEGLHSIQQSNQDSFQDQSAFKDSFRTPKTANKTASFAAASMAQRSPWGLSMLRSSNRKQGYENGNASFLTNASFNIAHDKMLQIITDVAPWTTRWHSMRSIDLRGRRVDSLVRIDEFLPRLEEALLDDNEIEYLTGLPNSLRHLSIARNRLPTTAAFGHLENLESLDVSDNTIDLRALRNLTQLRHLRVNSNRLKSLQGIQNLEKLETLHLRNNAIEEVEIEQDQWPLLQDLVLSRNRLRRIQGLDVLCRVRSLNLDHNQLVEVDLGIEMPKLKQLRVSGNHQLAYLDVAPAPNLRTLYADECSLDEVMNIGTLLKLDNLSLRQQAGQHGLQWPAHDIRDVKRLFLSGNAFRAADMASARGKSHNLFTLPSSKGITQFFGLVYLELSGCQLTSLPAELAEIVPNLRQLNADYNLLETLPRMNKMRRLKRLSLVGCRIGRSRKLVESLQGCEELNLLDVRMNPCTLGLYPPIIMAHPRGTKVNRAFLPPIPHPFFIASQDGETEEQQGDPKKFEGMGSFAEKSFFHKRHPPPPMMMMGEESRANFQNFEKEDEEGNPDQPETLFAASDLRFATTLPPHFKIQRLLHRGSLAMACENLTWLDGLLIDEIEVQKADELFRQGKGNEEYLNEDQIYYQNVLNQSRTEERSDSILSSDSEVQINL